MGKTALLVALVACGLAGWALYEQRGAREDLAAVTEGQQSLDGRLLAIERGLADLRQAPAPGETLSAPAPDSAAPADGAQGPALAGAPKPAPRALSLEQRLAKLEQDLAGRAKGAAAGARIEVPGADDDAPLTLSFGPRNWLGSLDQATKALNLDASQRSGLERVIEDVQREWAALREQPNEEGQTLKQLQESFNPTSSFGEEGMAGLHEHMAKVARFHASKVPGTNETYEQAARRIRKDGKARARSYLNADQAKTWDKSHTEALFGGGEAMHASVMVMDAAPVFEFGTAPGK